MDYFQLLRECGFTKKEASAYLALVEYGASTISKISQCTHINRPALYGLLPKLVDRGVISSYKKGKSLLYKAETPEKIESLYEEKHDEVKNGLSKLSEDFQKSAKVKPVVQYFEGKKGVSFVFDDIALSLREGDTYYRYTSRISKSKISKDSIYFKKRDSKRLEQMVITA